MLLSKNQIASLIKGHGEAPNGWRRLLSSTRHVHGTDNQPSLTALDGMLKRKPILTELGNMPTLIQGLMQRVILSPQPLDFLLQGGDAGGLRMFRANRHKAVHLRITSPVACGSPT